MDKYTIETGLASDGNPVIKCSPEMYDKLISECREIFSVIHLLSESQIKAFVEKYPAIGVLSTHPKFSEIIKK